MTPVVIDASAGVELIADTTRGRALRTLLPVDAVPWVPETFYVEVGSVLRRWDLNAILTPEQVSEALRSARRLAAARGPGTFIVRRCYAARRRHRKNLTFADATYVALAEHLDAEVLTDDHKLANAPTLAVRMLRLPLSP